MNKFFVEKSFVVGSGFEILNPEDVHHIVHVLRLIAGVFPRRAFFCYWIR